MRPAYAQIKRKPTQQEQQPQRGLSSPALGFRHTVKSITPSLCEHMSTLTFVCKKVTTASRNWMRLNANQPHITFANGTDTGSCLGVPDR